MNSVKRLVTAASVVLGLTLLAASPALAGHGVHRNPQDPQNPYAVAYTSPKGAVCISVYQAPPARGAAAPGKDARGGNPGWVFNGFRGPDC